MTTKILVVSDDGTPSGYGRISTEINRRLAKRGYHIMAASLGYDGLLPAMYESEPLPYHVASLQGKQNWPDLVYSIAGAYQPDIICVTQDAPYAQIVKSGPYDWSRIGFMVITPVDGAPIFPAWVEVGKKSDALMTISQFGVDTWRKAGVNAGLVRPGVNLNTFFPLSADKRTEIRSQLGIEADAFVLGVAAQNQGRKSIPQMMKAFFDFAADKPTARLLLDMDAQSPAGWDLSALCEQFGWDKSKIIFRADAVAKGVTGLNERYNILDAHAVLAFREGWGLPLVEAMACGVVSIAQDWCSGTEIVGGGKGVLIDNLDYFMPSTWGGALDKLPNTDTMTRKLQWLHENPDEKRAMAKRGMEWAREQTWDKAVDVVQANIERIIEKRKKSPVIAPVAVNSAIIKAVEPLPQSPDGVAQQVALVEG